LIYDRHDVYKKAGDFQLGATAGRVLYRDKRFKGKDTVIDLATFNGDILMAGHVPTTALRDEAQTRVMRIPGYRRVFNQLSVSAAPNNAIQDSWITAKIRSGILAHAEIDPDQFNHFTLHGIFQAVQAHNTVFQAYNRTFIAGFRNHIKLFNFFSD
jgi:osmotically-inducible protein OsmY